MNETDIEEKVLLELYKAYFSPEYYFNVYELCEKEGWEIKSFRNLIEQLKNKYLIKGFAPRKYALTSEGVIYTEKNQIAPLEDVKTNGQARTLILASLANIYEEQGYQYGLRRDGIVEQTGLSKIVVESNLRFLEGFDYAEHYGNAGHKITQRGLDAVKDYRKRKSIGEEFDEISKLPPQARGRALQKIVGKIIEQNGWKQEEGVKTSHEEMDNIAFKEREFYLVECKWEKTPIEGDVIREIFGKLGNRIDVRGIVISMSGFTRGAIKQAKNYIGQKVILLFGKESIESMIYGKTTFDELLNGKYKELIMRRKILPE